VEFNVGSGLKSIPIFANIIAVRAGGELFLWPACRLAAAFAADSLGA
jgi:hypothetical protein